MTTEKDIKKLVNDLGGEVTEIGILPDGSGFATASMPLLDDHWIYGSAQHPPMPMRMGTKHPDHKKVAGWIREAAKYAVKASTMSGKEDDFDPDALCQNMIVGLIGYWTEDGLSHENLFDPLDIPKVIGRLR